MRRCRSLIAFALFCSIGLWLGCGPNQKAGGPQPSGKKTDPAAAGKEAPAAAPQNPTEEPKDPAAPKPDPAAGSQAPQGTPYTIKVPKGLPAVPVPADNPMTEEKVALGRMLYFDKRLSKDGSVSCATCHDPKHAWAETTPVSTGVGGQKGGRNSPSVINTAYAPVLFWDGRAKSLEEQALGPIANPIEMGHSLDAMIAELNRLTPYKEHFQKVFGTEVTEEGVAKAIAAFERTILSGNSPYDKYQDGDENALTEAQKRGLEKFDNAGCATCHAPELFSNFRFYNAGVGWDKESPDGGLMEVTKKESDKGKFRVPMLRDVAKTAPYFHDGGTATLEEAVALMAAGGRDNPNLDRMFRPVRDAKLTEADQKDIVAFLNALSGEFPVIDPPELP